MAKIGLATIDSHLATAIRTMIVLVFAWLMVFIVGSQNDIWYVESSTWIFLILSGLATGGSWLCYFRALQLGNVNRVVPIDKSSTILTMIMAFIFLREPMDFFTVLGMIFIGIGTWLMLKLSKNTENEKGINEKESNQSWLFFAIMAAVFAGLTAILGRVGIIYVEANLGTAIRTLAVVPMSWIMVFITKGQSKIVKVDIKSWIFLILSGVATGASWLLFYNALQLGNAMHVVPIDKLSIVFTMVFAGLFLSEKFSKRSLIGLVLLTFGTLLPVFL
ncbi:MAG: EamA family transporter [Defluviitaleaceae bacterium]|nr:EamA family transporter [Defluviitaleaceae bacterium]